MIDIDGTKNGKPTHEMVDLIYPEIYDKNNLTTLEVGICHTRATDSIRISYESERDGYIIEQASIFQWDIDDDICDPDWKEVAFIKAWAREKE